MTVSNGANPKTANCLAVKLYSKFRLLREVAVYKISSRSAGKNYLQERPMMKYLSQRLYKLFSLLHNN